MFPEKAAELKIEVDFTAGMTVVNPFDFFVEPYAEKFPFPYPDDLMTADEFGQTLAARSVAWTTDTAQDGVRPLTSAKEVCRV